MRILRAMPALVLLALPALPGTEAALNGPQPYDASFGYLPGLASGQFTMASGRMEVVVPDGEGTWGFFGTGGAAVSGLTRVCWTSTVRQCADSAGAGLSIQVLPGGSFGLQLPLGADATITANHAVAIFTDLREAGNLNSLGLGLSLLAPLVEGEVRFASLPTIPMTTVGPTSKEGGTLAATEETTVIEVQDGAARLATLSGKVDPVTFAGGPALTPIAAELAVVPFQGNGALARFRPAERGDAEVGLDLPRINRLMGRFYAANAGSATPAQDIDKANFGPFNDVAPALFAGAVLSLATTGNVRQVGEEMAFARTAQLEVRGSGQNGLTWSGTAMLDMHDGQVEGAQRLYGLGFIALPWWGWMLWILALTVWVIRLVRKPDKSHPKWDRFKWVGWVASAVVFLLVFFLWDLEMRAVLGLSVLSGQASGQVLLLVALLQVATLGLASFAAIAPLRMLLRNGSVLLHQGTFMGLAGAAAGLLGFLLAATLLRSGLDLVLRQVLASIA